MVKHCADRFHSCGASLTDELARHDALMSADRLDPRSTKAPLCAAAFALSTLTTVAAVAAYLFFRTIDDANIARAEANGFDPTQLTPHGDLLWLLLTAAVPASMALTSGLLIALVACLRSTQR